MQEDGLEFYLSTTSLDDPQELLTLARAVDRDTDDELWEKILKRIDCFSQEREAPDPAGARPGNEETREAEEGLIVSRSSTSSVMPFVACVSLRARLSAGPCP